jgi:hypothetical protein
MSKPTRTEAELVAMARAELKIHADCPDGIALFATDDGREFHTEAERPKPGRAVANASP